MKIYLYLVILLLFSAVASAQSYTTVLEVGGNVSAPITVETNKGSFTVYNSLTLEGNYSIRSAKDANGKKIVVPLGNSNYHTISKGDNHTSTFVKTYVFSTLYNTPSSGNRNLGTHRYSYQRTPEERAARREERRQRTMNAIENNLFSFAQEIDLGLPSGNIWAGYNIGADSPLEAGDMFSWGELESKPSSRFNDIYYFDYYHGECLNYSLQDGKRTCLIPQHDAAYMLWGDEWQMPTYDDFKELVDCCDWQWLEYQKVRGWRGTGPNGRKIFFPVLGSWVGGEFDGEMSGYWTADLSADKTAYSFVGTLWEHHTDCWISEIPRESGLFIRPVMKDECLQENPDDLSSIITKPHGAEQEEELARQEARKAEFLKATQTLGSRADLSKLKVKVENNTLHVDDISYSFVKVEGGTFKMGAGKEQGKDAEKDEKPQHDVTLSTFNIGVTEISRAMWIKIMGHDNSDTDEVVTPTDDDYDSVMDDLRWNDCQEFIKILNALTGKKFRLPTEAEWEYAARGGRNSRNYKYSGSNDRKEVAPSNTGEYKLKAKKPNELGIYNMTGYVWEFCQDSFREYKKTAETNPLFEDPSIKRIVRGGGGIFTVDEDCRVTFRHYVSPKQQFGGLRLVLEE